MKRQQWLLPLVAACLAPLPIFAQAPAVAAQAPVVAPQPLTVEGADAHVYKSIGGADLRLHVFIAGVAQPGARRPAIIFFFGGGWTPGSIAQFVPQAKHFAERGMVAIVADYRVFARHGTSPIEAVSDAKSAVCWVRAQADRLGMGEVPKDLAWTYTSPDLDVRWRVTVEGSSLTIPPERGEAIALSPVFADAFSDGFAIARFVRDGRGAVVAMEMSAGGRARRVRFDR